MTDKKEIISKVATLCEMVSNDMKSDAANFDGKPFNGKTVAEYFGYQGAAISALADILKEVIKII